MTQEKSTTASHSPFGFTGKDYIFLAVLVLVLLSGLLVANRLVRQRGQSPAAGSPSPVAAAVGTEPPTETPTALPTEQPNTPTPLPTATPSLTQSVETATSTATLAAEISPTFTEVPELTATPTALLPTIIAAPVEDTPTSSPIPPVDTATPTSTSTQTTAVVTPQPATIAYVQSNGQAHDLGLVTSGGALLNAGLHQFAAAPAWSPDGTTIAFFGEPGINQLDGDIYKQGNGVWIIQPQTGNLSKLIDTDHVKNMSWSPDGMKLAYEFGPPDSTHEVIVVDARDGSRISNFAGEQPAWSPDSQKLAIKACAPECGLWQINFDGRDGRRITFSSSDSYPTWSPTGEYLAFTSQQNGSWDIYRLDLASGEQINLTNRPAADTTPVFSPDGQEIYVRTNLGDWRITAISLDGSNERLIKEGVGPSDDWGLARPSVR